MRLRAQAASPEVLAGALAPGPGLLRADPGDPPPLRGADREDRHRTDPRRLQRRGHAAPRRSSPARSRSSTRRSAGNQKRSQGPQLNAFVLPDDASARVYDVEENVVTSNEDAVPLGTAAARPHRLPRDAGGDRTDPRRKPVGDRLRPVRAQHQPRRRDDRPGLAADLRRHPRWHPAGRDRRGRDRPPGDAADRLADRDGAGDRDHPRSLAADAGADRRRRGRRAGADPGGDAALARRGAGRTRGR